MCGVFFNKYNEELFSVLSLFFSHFNYTQKGRESGVVFCCRLSPDLKPIHVRLNAGLHPIHYQFTCHYWPITIHSLPVVSTRLQLKKGVFVSIKNGNERSSLKIAITPIVLSPPKHLWWISIFTSSSINCRKYCRNSKETLVFGVKNQWTFDELGYVLPMN